LISSFASSVLIFPSFCRKRCSSFLMLPTDMWGLPLWGEAGSA
jgi:hypothetical protein